MNKRELERAIEREVEEWPDVTVEFMDGGKHPKAKFKFGGKVLSRAYPGTPSDAAFGLHQTLGDMRRAMKQLGAVRTKPEPSKDEDEAPYRKPNDGASKRPDPSPGPKADPKPTVTDQLVAAGVGALDQMNSAAEKVFAVGADLLDAAEARADKVKAAKAGMLATSSHGSIDSPEAPESRDAEDEIRAAFKARVDSIVDGIYFDLPDDVYHAVPRLSSSGLQKICVSPANFWRNSWLDPERPEEEENVTLARLLGKAYHTARLEPHLYDDTYFRELEKSEMPKGTLITGTDMSAMLEEIGLKKSGTNDEKADRLLDHGFPAAKIWVVQQRRWEEERRGRVPIPAKYFDQMKSDMARIHGNHQIAPLLTGGQAEVSIFWTDKHGIKMKARTDYLAKDWWADFKTFDNSRGKPLKQCLADAVRYNRYYVQATVYRDAIEAIRLDNLQIVGPATDDQRALIASIQLKPDELKCWYIFQEKGGVPNLLAYEFPFYSIPYTTLFNEQITDDEQRRIIGREATKRETGIWLRGKHEVIEAKKLFALYSQVYEPGEPWAPIDAIGSFSDDDFHPFWLENGGA